MIRELLEHLQRREERVEIGGVTLVVRELESAADVASLRVKDATERNHRLIVLCTFDAEGKTRVFSDEDVPALMAGSKVKLNPLIDAVARVNGFDEEANRKNSPAAQS